MTHDNDVLLELAGAVADRTPVAWERVEAEDRRVEGLKAVERVSAAFERAGCVVHPGEGVTTPGEVLFEWGHLKVIDSIGEGSFGEVYRAWDPVLEREVALKLWVGPGPGGFTARRRFLAEAKLLARVRHPNVLVVHGADIHEGRAGLWTDLVEGETLEERLAAGGPLGADEAAVIGVDLCRAVAAVHRAGLVHGDIKASNVMRERGGRIVLMDFGAGIETGSPLGGSCGTPLAMAPEVLNGAAPAPTSDLYSIGVLLYRLTTGRYPLEATTLDEVVEGHCEGRRIPLADLRPDLPAGFLEVVERAMAAAPEDRFPSAGAMERALSRLVSVRSATVGAIKRPLTTTRIVGFAMAVLLTVVGTGWFLSVQRFRGALTPAEVRSLAIVPMAQAEVPSTPFARRTLAWDLHQRLRLLSGLKAVLAEEDENGGAAAADPRSMGREIGVKAVLESGVEGSGEAMVVWLRLADVKTGKIIWSDRETGTSDTQFLLEERAVQGLIGALGLSEAEGAEAARSWRPPAGVAAHTAWLAGKHRAAQGTPRALWEAITDFERAVQLEPGFARGHADLTAALADLAMVDGDGSPSGVWERAGRAAARAVALDPDLAAGHDALAVVSMYHDWNWQEAWRELSLAMQLSPKDVEIMAHTALLFSVLGRHEEAVAAVEHARMLDPDSAVVRRVAGRVYLEAGRFDDALQQLREAVAQEPAHPDSYQSLADVYAEIGQLEEFAAQWEIAARLRGEAAELPSSLGAAYESSGMAGVWSWELERLQRRAATGHVSPALVSRAHAALGHRQEALEWFSKAVREHDPLTLRVKEDPAFYELRFDPRFRALHDAMGLDVELPGTPVSFGTESGSRGLWLSAGLYREREGRPVFLPNGANVSPGDGVFLDVVAPEPVHIYVFDEDQRGQVFVLFPLSQLDTTNPAGACRRVQLPGPKRGRQQSWVVTSAGGREVILVVASREKVPELEEELSRVGGAVESRTAERRPVRPGGRNVLRGVGGLGAAGKRMDREPHGRLTRLAARLTGRAARGELWLREFVLVSSNGWGNSR